MSKSSTADVLAADHGRSDHHPARARVTFGRSPSPEDETDYISRGTKFYDSKSDIDKNNNARQLRTVSFGSDEVESNGPPPISEETREAVVQYIRFVIESAMVLTNSGDLLVLKTDEPTGESETDPTDTNDNFAPQLTQDEEATDMHQETTIINRDSRSPTTQEKQNRSQDKEATFTLPPILQNLKPTPFEICKTRQTYVPLPDISTLPQFPRQALPKKWGVPLTPVEQRTVLVGFTCPPVHRFRPHQLLCNSAAILSRYYNKPCNKTVEWVKLTGKHKK